MKPYQARLGLNGLLLMLGAVLEEGASRAAQRLGWSGKQESRNVPSEKLSFPMMSDLLKFYMDGCRCVGVVWVEISL